MLRCTQATGTRSISFRTSPKRLAPCQLLQPCAARSSSCSQNQFPSRWDGHLAAAQLKAGPWKEPQEQHALRSQYQFPLRWTERAPGDLHSAGTQERIDVVRLCVRSISFHTCSRGDVRAPHSNWRSQYRFPLSPEADVRASLTKAKKRPH